MLHEAFLQIGIVLCTGVGTSPIAGGNPVDDLSFFQFLVQKLNRSVHALEGMVLIGNGSRDAMAARCLLAEDDKMQRRRKWGWGDGAY